MTDLADPRLVRAFEQVGATATDVIYDHVPPGDQSGPEAWEKRLFRAPASWRRTHLHVRAAGRPIHRNALLFRDHLRHSTTAYAQVKLRAGLLTSWVP